MNDKTMGVVADSLIPASFVVDGSLSQPKKMAVVILTRYVDVAPI